MARKPADQSVSRREIIIAAADVLRENGYDATTMKDIAARVNLTAASLYHHFKSKDFLLLAVLEVGLDIAIEEIEPIARDNTITNTAKLRQMIQSHITGVTSNTAFGAAMVFEIKSLMSAGFGPRGSSTNEQESIDEFIARRDAFFSRRDEFEKLFRSVIESGIAAGEFRQVDAAIVAKAMLGAHNWVGVWFKPDGRLSGQQVADIMSDTFLVSLMTTQEQPA
ncbi:TetR family transcriptional regulator [Phototrophicus methaneseepsis]|uniref:TetR family transcriptional regulator n=1 Tax=Phototrophicus methaneseepsis TaxID=2710758 RepID=A0A7S8IEM6_9CHLR|nr:TetR/AcrR family transcriptional regulator [Phototrophicus methaneseepsis]QPC81973.1 TetR family transcriptional regulator [Phototrophicus methaneseepsis]